MGIVHQSMLTKAFLIGPSSQPVFLLHFQAWTSEMTVESCLSAVEIFFFSNSAP